MSSYTLFVCKLHGKAEIRPTNSIEVELGICRACLVRIIGGLETFCDTKDITLFQWYKAIERR